MTTAQLTLDGFRFEELFTAEGLQRLDRGFLDFLAKTDQALADRLLAYRAQIEMSPVEVSELLLACAPLLEWYVAVLFDIEDALEVSRLKTLSHDPVFVFKQFYVLRQAKRKLNKAAESGDFAALNHWLAQQIKTVEKGDRELAIAAWGTKLLNDQDAHQADIEKLTDWCVLAMTTSEGRAAVEGWVSFHLPKRIDHEHLVEVVPAPNGQLGRLQGPASHYRHRDGFALTDPRMSERQALNEIHYCVYCHKTEGDFCSKGFPVKKGQPELGFKTNPLDEVLTGCPLEEKISEMHVLKKAGHTIGALAMIMVDNPMVPATGHRVCNDCMKACIYQKQEPVNIPQTETRILTDVLELPWGVEIYDLLTRWNPLRRTQWAPKPYNGLKVLVMGMGPAGYTLAHHLLMEGFAVVGTEGLKIEPLPQPLITQPIYRFDDIKEPLESRVMAGFGGVAEYGITVRWDKNFLKLIYISLARRPYFQVFGGVRFGGTLRVEDAWELGFDHMALAVGAGLPRELRIPGSLASGMRQANDFLMALQLTGAAKKTSLANLQMRMPAVVIGGGLTGIDTATEAQAYYIAQVEKTLERYETLTKVWGEARVREQFTAEEFEILQEFLTHGKEVRRERELADHENRAPHFIKLLHAWGGVTVAYRRLMSESPAYKRNYEEVAKALEEGVYYAEGLEPVAVRLDERGHVAGLVTRSRVLDENGNWMLSDEEHFISARSIFVATGAKPNIAYEFEHRGTFHREGDEYQAYDEIDGKLKAVHPEGHVKIPAFGAFTSYEKEHHRVTFLGDTHPVFHGNVVKAIASAKRTYPKIVQSLKEKISRGDEKEYQQFAAHIRHLFSAKIVGMKRHTPSVVEIKVQAPQAVKNFLPGQFFRVQNYETLSPVIHGTRLQTEAIPLLGAGVDNEKGTVSFMVLEQGASSRLFATLKVGDPISVMGPTGVRTKIPHDRETVMVVGGRLGAAHIRATGKALREAGNRVLYIAGFQAADEVYSQDELEEAADVIVWVTQTGEPVRARRPQDRSVTGDFMSCLLRYARGELEVGTENPIIPLQEVNRVLIVGSQTLVRMINEARQRELKTFFTQSPAFIASIYGPMQCMLKGVCAQCLQWQIDPKTGKRTKAVYACSWHDQPLEQVDLDNLSERLSQNRVQEILTNLWLDYLFAHHKVERI